MDEEYNGWKNKPTWLVYTWLSNEENLYRIAVALSRDPNPNALKEWINDHQLQPGGLFTDLLQWALDSVDWDRLVEAFREREP